MALKAALLNFNGIIINDEEIRQTLSEQVLLAENLRPNPDDYRAVCLGRSDRACLKALLSQRGRMVSDDALSKLLAKENAAYTSWLKGLDKLFVYPGIEDLIFRCRTAHVKLAIVTGVETEQVTHALEKAELREHFPVVVAGDDISAEGSKPAPDGYLKAIEKLNSAYADLDLKADECIAIEDTFSGIEAAKQANIPVVGVAHTYPNHMLQRRANWVVDYLREVNFDWIGEPFGGVGDPAYRASSASDEAVALGDEKTSGEASGETSDETSGEDKAE